MANLDRLVDVQINLSTTGISKNSYSDLLFMVPHALAVGRTMVITSADELLDVGFKSTDAAYKAAVACFSQAPHIKQMYVGRKSIDALTLAVGAVKNGNSYGVTLGYYDADGELVTTPVSVVASTGNDEASIATDLAAAINAVTDVPVTATATAGSIEIEATVSGTPFSVKPTSTLTQTAATSAESWADALAAAKKAKGSWYGLAISSREEADMFAAAEWAEANEKLFGTASASNAVINADSNTDIASELKQKQYYRTFVYADAEANTEYSEVAVMSKCFTFYPGGETWANQKLAGITADNLAEGEFIAAKAKNANTFEMFNDDFAITQNGKVAAGEWIDVIRFRDWLKTEMQTDVASALINAKGKVPYTDEGILVIVNAMQQSLALGTQRKGIAPDELDAENNIRKGYEIFYPSASSISANTKASRILQDVGANVRLAGAINAVEIKVNLGYEL